MASALKNSLELMGFIVLWGVGKSGKTSTLRMLFEEMFRDPKTKNVPITITSFLSNHKDFRIIIRYKELFVYLSTYGDTLEDTQANISFFDGEYANNRLHIYQPGFDVKQLDDGINYLQDFTPSFCISACRSDGRVPLPLEYYVEKMRIHTSSIVWLNKEKESEKNQYQNANRLHAIEICEFIERKIQSKLI